MKITSENKISFIEILFHIIEYFFTFDLLTNAWSMVVISYKTIRDFTNKHPDATDPLNNWYSIIQKGFFGNFNELRKVFNSVDAVGNDRYVFNIRGNKYRLIALIHFKVRTVYILFVGTHAEYDKVEASMVKYKK